MQELKTKKDQSTINVINRNYNEEKTNSMISKWEQKRLDIISNFGIVREEQERFEENFLNVVNNKNRQIFKKEEFFRLYQKKEISKLISKINKKFEKVTIRKNQLINKIGCSNFT